MTTELSRSVF